LYFVGVFVVWWGVGRGGNFREGRADQLAFLEVRKAIRRFYGRVRSQTVSGVTGSCVTSKGNRREKPNQECLMAQAGTTHLGGKTKLT